MFEIITWTISGVALLGTILNSHREKSGFYLWFFTNLAWTIIDFRAGLYAQSGLFLAYTYLAIKGMVNWSRLEKQDKHIEEECEYKLEPKE